MATTTTSTSPTGGPAVSFRDLAYLPLVRSLTTAINITTKAQQHVASSSSSDPSSPTEEDVVTARLAPDMYPFWQQCYQLRKTTSNVVQRLSATTPGPVTDPARPEEGTITTFAQCLAILQAARDELDQAVTDHPDLFADEQAPAGTSVQYGPLSLPVSKKAYLEGMMVPNLNFHLAMVYAILRMKGVPLGKVDYMGPFFADYVDMDEVKKEMAAAAAAKQKE
ncbi:uncharacterized protein B0I36DRAFT_363455 [Microdochium trichocladiopsis]|uniref:DUF1993 domain-containing protein n=1 Tax=Microdochium trichocladiopsis TaxID=1682393 RepID=A0A9P8Y333_9PEZI|nr:uncharacterized protein B0I36DRAFT_363455 [Microdochium trichocladiopsis]KAH7028833.1 hypothetical protein B0I36DRAFT_363455 [Microdochium trichocladiopsis]